MANKITSFSDLDAWQQAHALAVATYKATKNFPVSEQFGLTSQLRRAVVSIGSNIAEGFARQSLREKKQFYSVARGSIVESQSQLLLARDIGYLSDEEHKALSSKAVRVHKLLNGLISSLRSWSEPNTKYEKPVALSNRENA